MYTILDKHNLQEVFVFFIHKKTYATMSTTDLNFHNKIAKLCFEHFNLLPKCGKPKENEWTILSCIVQEDEGKFEVIALGTGSKCIGHDKMSKCGDILNDSHAEIMCRRAFLRYLYENMLSQENKVCNFDSEKQHFYLKNCLKFHFFTTHVPCGDAAIFAKQNVEYFGNLIDTANSSFHEKNLLGSDEFDDVEKKKIKLEENDIYRTGAKCLESDVKQDLHLEGINYHVTGVVRIKPGRGVRTLSVSCSDKLAKWCHLGIQGALLSILLKEPIYLSSFTIAGGTPFDKEAMERALFHRLGDVQLEHPYHRSRMILEQASFTFSFSKSDEKKPCPSSITWLKINNSKKQIEVAVEGRRQGITKKQIKTAGKLKICKAELFNYFIQIIKQFRIQFVDDLSNLSYKNAKLYSKQYQKSWTILKKSFKVWTVKSEHLLQFHV